MEDNISLFFDKNNLDEDKNISTDNLRNKVVDYIKSVFARILNINKESLDSHATFENYGVDSLLGLEINKELEKDLGRVSATLLFENITIDALTDYFIKNRKEKLHELLFGGELKEDSNDIASSEIEEYFFENTKFNKSNVDNYSEYYSPENMFDSTAKNKDIAIVGLSGRYPKADSLLEFWKNLEQGLNCITEVPSDRWEHRDIFDKDKNELGKSYSKWGGFINDVDKFDPLFFGISPKEAELIDPQERLFLETVWHTLEDAGYSKSSIRGTNTGVFVGVMYGHYELYSVENKKEPFGFSGSSYASIANRISYFFDFNGPSIAVDTMCSSSLTAIHLACKSILNGEIDQALAGGVNLTVHPHKYLLLSQGQFLSSDGLCRSFGEGGDGYVPGEGVGAVLLKPLSKAIEDRDYIYGVIKGTTLNHGGKTGGYTVPNPNAQYDLIRKAFEHSGVDPRSISYIEAHGTGTSLGDPIEIAGLTRVFEEYTPNRQFCSIGSVKSNIGHTESAAGIAALTKVLLQMKYKELVPSLHSETLNSKIDFSETPFYVQRELAEWKQPIVDGKEVPRRAGISSFGAGGSNAHLVIEEYINDDLDNPQVIITSQNPALIVLSAMDEDRLKEQAEQLLKMIDLKEFLDADLANIAYTLQVGREAMEERLGLVVVSIKELKEKLKAFIDDKKDLENLYHGHVKRNKKDLEEYTKHKDMIKIIEKWLVEKKYNKLTELWSQGLTFDWNKLYNTNKPQRISLPTYPFARERYWIPDAGSSITRLITDRSQSSIIHPLLHENTSDLSEQRFSTIFTGEEFFLKDHVVNGERVLPGVAYLEMALRAVEYAAESMEENNRIIKFEDIVWVEPVVVGEQEHPIHISLFPDGNGEIIYEIYGDAVDNTEAIVSQGKVELTSISEVPSLDIKSLQSECSKDIVSGKQCYETFRNMGVEYETTFQGIEELYLGEDQLLTKIRLPSSAEETLSQFVLHPSIMESSIQASLVLLNGLNKSKIRMPVSLAKLEVFDNCTSVMWAFIKYSQVSESDNNRQMLDIHICDENGVVCVRMSRMAYQELTESMLKKLRILVSKRASLFERGNRVRC